jgi:hypothetical protein
MKVLITVTAILLEAAAAVNKELPDESSGNRMHYTTGDRYSERYSTVKKNISKLNKGTYFALSKK